MNLVSYYLTSCHIALCRIVFVSRHTHTTIGGSIVSTSQQQKRREQPSPQQTTTTKQDQDLVLFSFPSLFSFRHSHARTTTTEGEFNLNTRSSSLFTLFTLPPHSRAKGPKDIPARPYSFIPAIPSPVHPFFLPSLALRSFLCSFVLSPRRGVVAHLLSIAGTPFLLTHSLTPSRSPSHAFPAPHPHRRPSLTPTCSAFSRESEKRDAQKKREILFLEIRTRPK